MTQIVVTQKLSWAMSHLDIVRHLIVIIEEGTEYLDQKKRGEMTQNKGDI